MQTPDPAGILEQFNHTITTWINYLDDYTLEMLHQQPLPGSWSLGQVYIHIIDDTQYQAGQMKQALTDVHNSHEDMHPNARQMFLHNSFPDIQIEGPATNTPIRQPQSKEELREALLQIKADVNKSAEDQQLLKAKGKSLHPGLLYFSAAEWVQFMEMHMRHHFRQKERIDMRLFTC
ncbi:DinB superfamily protein [Chitinophaga sp. YR627]|uniref:DinB family protein n=1 Tax=Chitinophaga sp. YR627 TaxID=1881041 RepID=UPI0008ED808F|nr:DinB family protein [Chitinophaga sp. YR627]SFN42969.1 DinB superfamily protein [Chitinophaga sp. YR627]